VLDGRDDIHTLDDTAKDDVLAIEPSSLDGGQEELRAVGVGTSVGHREEARTGVLELEVLIGELVAIDRLATSAITAGEVATLAHELRNDTVELGALVVQWLAALAHALLAGAQSTEVLGSAWNNIVEELRAHTHTHTH
jgi:hypothetical protein